MAGPSIRELEIRAARSQLESEHRRYQRVELRDRIARAAVAVMVTAAVAAMVLTTLAAFAPRAHP